MSANSTPTAPAPMTMMDFGSRSFRTAPFEEITVVSSIATLSDPGDAPALRAIYSNLPAGSALVAEISEIDMSRRDGPVLYTVDGVEVRLGAGDWEERLARLEGVLGQVATQDVRTVDLRFRDQVVFQRGGSR